MATITEAKPEAATLSNDEILRYSRHLIMPEVGMEGQLKLKAAKVLIPCPRISQFVLSWTTRRVEWTPGTINLGNLRGTRRTLDQCAEAARLEEGLLSRDGWALHDDSGSVCRTRIGSRFEDPA